MDGGVYAIMLTTIENRFPVDEDHPGKEAVYRVRFRKW